MSSIGVNTLAAALILGSAEASLNGVLKLENLLEGKASVITAIATAAFTANSLCVFAGASAAWIKTDPLGLFDKQETNIAQYSVEAFSDYLWCLDGVSRLTGPVVIAAGLVSIVKEKIFNRQ